MRMVNIIGYVYPYFTLRRKRAVELLNQHNSFFLKLRLLGGQQFYLLAGGYNTLNNSINNLNIFLMQ